MPKVEIRWTEGNGSTNPFTKESTGPYAEAALGDAGGLTEFGARLERLMPGSASSFRHWHETEDELVYILEGELVLVEETDTPLRAGDAAAWPAGAPVGHCLINRSDRPALMLVVGTRAASGRVHYPDVGLVLHHDAQGRRFTREDGSPID